MSVEAQEMLCAEADEALAPWGWDLKPESLASDVRHQESKFILYPVLAFCHLFGALSRV